MVDGRRRSSLSSAKDNSSREKEKIDDRRRRSLSSSSNSNSNSSSIESASRFGKRCLTVVKQQRTRFYILRRCISILLCWHDHAVRAAKAFSLPSHPSSDSVSSASFANLKLTAEKMVQEQASLRTHLEMANSKLKKSAEHIHSLEENLQDAINENAFLSQELESKSSSNETLCDQLNETLQYLAGQIQEGEQDRKLFEDKLSASSKVFDGLHLQIKGLSEKLESAEETIRSRDQELMELRIEKEEREKYYRDEHCRASSIIEGKDGRIKQLEATVAADKLAKERLNSRLEKMSGVCKCWRTTQENLEKEKGDLQSSNEDLAENLIKSYQVIKGLEDMIHGLVVKLIELDKQSVTLSDGVVHLSSEFDTCYKLVQQEKEFAAKHTQKKYDRLHDQFLHCTSGKVALLSVNQELNKRVIELQKVQKFVMVQHAEECCLAEVKIRRLGSEAEILVSKKIELEMLVTKSEEKIKKLSETSKLTESKMRDLLLKCSALEYENQDTQGKLQGELQEKAEEIDTLQKEVGKHEQLVDSLEKQVRQLHDSLDEKEQLHLQLKGREKRLEDQKEEIQASVAASESKLAETKKQYDQMLESKQSELSKHLKEISQRNDHAINDIRGKYEVEKLEIVNLEKEKVERVIREMERNCDKKLAESKQELKQYLSHIQEEQTALINRIKEEHDRKESSLRADHSEELKHVELQAENELRVKTMSLRKEQEVQIRALRLQHENECRKLQEELELQKSKEERQRRALLQLQWKVMDDNPQEDQEVNSKEDYSISSIKMGDTDSGKRSRHSLIRSHKEEKDSLFLRAKQTPVANTLKKVEKVNTGTVVSIPGHSRTVTQRESEVETSYRTISKRRKMKSTVMFGDPRKHKMESPKTKITKYVAEVIKGGDHSSPSNIGDLFTEGSLDPYTDDP
ncbi:hypothetical protein HHK36_012065 [Tetracentron sinense]|uniref:Uncharacterized protein n=1 Tax=Tetracentron sinense TaxID=13715 RepID=A0A834ZF18_TETSI|nr:hypothetical protein HHK36_012065 [Tetracentron sinense]